MNTVDLLRRLEEELFEAALCTGALEFGGRAVPVEVLALSARSADLRCPDDLAEDGAVTLVIDGFRRFEGELVRRHGRIIGMAFRRAGDGEPEPEPVADRAPRDAVVPRGRALRQHLRSVVFWSGAVQAGRESVDCIVLNMSPGGAKVKLLRRFSSDDSPVVLHIDRMGGYAAEVVWSEGDLIGVRFLKDPQGIAADMEKVLGRIAHQG